ncbi:hypothetical protein [Cohnella rhizosphaerae]|uniref:DUF4309 domain-containing protein n=1 Tax=Cohnella rhizosphaerae TaxID=1457232 RepID=A0A9X4KZG9_9BACL|nr:hypothetical protein [Cohnella rhizosphaerae]MDG0814206.1 hypothetical protein [Cohnella rhizosphaerae]
MRKLLLCVVLLGICLIPLSVSGVSDKQETAVAQENGVEAANFASAPSYPAYISKITSMDGVTYLTVDYIQFLQGEEADRVFRQQEPDAGMDEAPDGYYILNEEKKTYTLPVAADAQVLMQIYNRSGSWDDADIVENEPISVAKLRSLFSGDNQELMGNFPYYVTVVDGKVVRIVQQFVP